MRLAVETLFIESGGSSFPAREIFGSALTEVLSVSALVVLVWFGGVPRILARRHSPPTPSVGSQYRKFLEKKLESRG